MTYQQYKQLCKKVVKEQHKDQGWTTKLHKLVQKRNKYYYEALKQ